MKRKNQMKRMQCELSAVPMRREPSDRSEMTNQILFGETMQLLDENEKWLMVRLDHDNYEGWVDRKQVASSANKSERTLHVSQLFQFVQKMNGGDIVIPAGSFLPANTEGEFLTGDSTFIIKEGNSVATKSNCISIAQMFLGAPYLWGGRTFMGIDCSGLTQIVLRICGINLPRDAYQQAEQGESVTFIEESIPGDLAFFDNAEGKITHVGIIFLDTKNDRKIIHASGEVRIDCIDHQGIFNKETGQYTHHLRIIKRMPL